MRIGLAYVSFGAIVSLAPIEVPRLDEAVIDLRTLLFALVLCLGTAVMVGLLPAWRHERRPTMHRAHLNAADIEAIAMYLRSLQK